VIFRELYPLEKILKSKAEYFKLTEDQISNMLIVSPPKELQEDKNAKGSLKLGELDVDFLKAEGLANAIDIAQAEVFKDRLSQNLLEQINTIIGEKNKFGFTDLGQECWYNHPFYRPCYYHFISAITKKNMDLLGGSVVQQFIFASFLVLEIGNQ
jgi:hypothetical protein